MVSPLYWPFWAYPKKSSIRSQNYPSEFYFRNLPTASKTFPDIFSPFLGGNVDFSEILLSIWISFTLGVHFKSSFLIVKNCKNALLFNSATGAKNRIIGENRDDEGPWNQHLTLLLRTYGRYGSSGRSFAACLRFSPYGLKHKISVVELVLLWVLKTKCGEKNHEVSATNSGNNVTTV